MNANPMAIDHASQASPPPDRGWWRVVGAAIVAALLLFSGPLRCTAPAAIPPRAEPVSAIVQTATTWSCASEVMG